MFKDWVKFLSGIIIVITAAYTYYHLSGGSGVVNFLAVLLLVIAGGLTLLIIYWQGLDELKGNKKYVRPKNKEFWLLAIYFASPILCNGASVLLRIGGYETAAYYTFKLRYWSLLKTPLLVGLVYMFYFMVSRGVKRSRPQPSKKVQQATLAGSADIT